ncbi:MAG: radical SAM/SPASM domain-containing protein [Deltaproteobacteria bacterium]|nr:radical SAM/SPASM domain-containing protein [Deltaproteobacteria bacterium]
MKAMTPYTSLPITNRYILKDILPLKKPFTVLIEPSSLCNFRCIQCFQSIRGESYFTRNRGNLSLEAFGKVIRQLEGWKGNIVKVLKLSLYGEPLINGHFCEMLEIARKANVAERIETTTNAFLLARNIADKMVEQQLDYLRVSIYATAQKRHEEITGVKKGMRIIRENLSVLQDIKRERSSQRPFVSAKMMDTYGDGNERFLGMYRGIVDEAYIDKPHGWIRNEHVDFIGKYYGERVSMAREDMEKGSTGRIACPMAFTTMAVRSNGDVSPCCVDYIGGTNLGNIFERDLKEIWESREWYEFQRMQLEGRKNESPSCSRCSIYRSDYYTRDIIDGFPIEKLITPKGR